MAYTKLAYHIVYGTKNRESNINSKIQSRLYQYTGGIIRGLKGIPVEINGMADHIHILAYVPPVISISDFVGKIKANSSKWINNLPDYPCHFRWASKYAAFTISDSDIEKVRRYIQQQKEHHTRESWETEFIRLLKECGITYNENYLWD